MSRVFIKSSHCLTSQLPEAVIPVEVTKTMAKKIMKRETGELHIHGQGSLKSSYIPGDLEVFAEVQG